jgi:uncharacterized membrane protein
MPWEELAPSGCCRRPSGDPNPILRPQEVDAHAAMPPTGITGSELRDTGIWLALHVGYPLTEGWIVLSVALYLVTGAFWLPVVWMRMRMCDLAAEATARGAPLPEEYLRLFRALFVCGFPAFAAVLVIFWLMIQRPPIALW